MIMEVYVNVPVTRMKTKSKSGSDRQNNLEFYPSVAETWIFRDNYRQVSNIRRTLAGNKFVDHSDVVGASPVGAAPTTSSFST